MEKILSDGLAVKYIVEDSSFVVALLDQTDSLHDLALEAFRLLLSQKNNVRVIIPSTVFYETLFVLLKNEVSYFSAKSKLVNLMMIDSVVNLAITETYILKLARHTEVLIKNKKNKTKVRSNDLLITSIACDQENSCLLTSDAGMKEYDNIYPNIFLYNSPEGIEALKNFISSK